MAQDPNGEKSMTLNEDTECTSFGLSTESEPVAPPMILSIFKTPGLGPPNTAPGKILQCVSSHFNSK